MLVFIDLITKNPYCVGSTVVLLIREIPSLDLGPDNDCPGLSFFFVDFVSSYVSNKVYYIRIGYDHFILVPWDQLFTNHPIFRRFLD